MGRGSSTASGAATGAAIGSAIPVIGTGIGAGIGAGIGFLTGGKKKKEKRSGATKLARQQLADLTQRSNELQNQRPEESAGYLAGKGQLADLMRNLTQRDTSQAARRGLTGSEFEIAQAANRNRVQSDTGRELIANAERTLSIDQQNALARMMQALGMYGQFDNQDKLRKDAQNANTQNTFASLAAAAPAIYGAFKGKPATA